MNDDKWFVLKEGSVKGPFAGVQVESDFLHSNAPVLVWGRGQLEWIQIAHWKDRQLNPEPHAVTQAVEQRLWKVKAGQNELKPMSYEQMIAFLKTKKDLREISIWTDGYSSWKEVYQIHKIADELGVSRRAHPRVPIMGQLSCETPEKNFELKVLSISEGGLGASEGHQIRIGDRYKVILKSPNLYSPIHASVEVVYAGADGYVGMRFVGIQSESKSAIIEYVKKFDDEKTAIRNPASPS